MNNRRKQALEQPAQQEPLAKDNSNYRLDPPGLDPLYTRPQAREPKNEEFIKYAWANSSPNIGFTEFLSLFRSVEAAHGIKGDA